MLLCDLDIRESLHELLIKRFIDTNTIIVDELALSWGDARVDVAVVNCKLHGFEIKSDRDTLERLPRQVEIYNKIFDDMTLVCSEKWVPKAEKIIPKWWGISLPITDENGNLKIEHYRSAEANLDVDVRTLLELTWKDEAISILEERGLARGYKSKPRWDIWDRIVEVMDEEDVKKSVRECLKARRQWRSTDSLRRLCAD